jgi:RNA polymerase sigma-70 factor (ECF subfamily)
MVAADVRAENAEWLVALAGGERRSAAVSRLHRLLLGAARAESMRRLATLPDAVRAELDDLCVQAADDALMTVMSRLDSFRGDSRFTTWAYSFAIFQISTRLRRHAWRERRTELDGRAWERLIDRAASTGPARAENREIFAAVRTALAERLTDRQRLVFEAAVLQDVPIDVLAERLRSTRGAIYKALHDARLKLRAALVDAGYREFES